MIVTSKWKLKKRKIMMKIVANNVVAITANNLKSAGCEKNIHAMKKVFQSKSLKNNVFEIF